MLVTRRTLGPATCTGALGTRARQQTTQIIARDRCLDGNLEAEHLAVHLEPP